MEAPTLPSLAAYLYHYIQPYLPPRVGEEFFAVVLYSWVAGLFWVLLGILGMRKRNLVPTGLQNFVEWVVEALDNWFAEVMGSRDEARRYLPFLGSFFLYILAMNWMGMMPFFHAPTSLYSTTLPLALVAMFGTWGIAISRIGLKGFFYHLIGEPLWLVWLNFPLHFIGELAKILSLSMRLFGNIFAEDTVLAAFVMVSGMFLYYVAPIILPVIFLFLMVLFGLLQAVIFSSLTAVYITMWLPAGGH